MRCSRVLYIFYCQFNLPISYNASFVRLKKLKISFINFQSMECHAWIEHIPARMLFAFAKRVASSALHLREESPICSLQIERAFLGSQSHKACKNPVYFKFKALDAVIWVNTKGCGIGWFFRWVFHSFTPHSTSTLNL